MDRAGGLYGKLEERILARDQVGARAVFYDLIRAGRPRTEVLQETVRVHAPYTHVPYHPRIDNGSPTSPSPASSTCRTGCSTTAPTPPDTRATALARRSSWAVPSAGTTRTTSSTPGRSTWPSARAGTPPTRWRAR